METVLLGVGTAAAGAAAYIWWTRADGGAFRKPATVSFLETTGGHVDVRCFAAPSSKAARGRSKRTGSSLEVSQARRLGFTRLPFPPDSPQLLVAAVHDAGADGLFEAKTVRELEAGFRAHARETSAGEFILDASGFIEVCKGLGIRDTGIISTLFSKWDTDRSGTIEFKEFLHVLAFSRRASAREKVETAFDLMDVNHDGSISHKEMAGFFKTVYRTIGKPKTPSQVMALVHQVFARIDKDMSQAVEKHEFLSAASSVHLSTGDTLVTLMDAMMARFGRISKDSILRAKSGIDVEAPRRRGAGGAPLGASKSVGATAGDSAGSAPAGAALTQAAAVAELGASDKPPPLGRTTTRI